MQCIFPEIEKGKSGLRNHNNFCGSFKVVVNVVNDSSGQYAEYKNVHFIIG